MFINAPNANASRQLIPVHRAINMLAPSFPVMATTIINAHIAQLCQSFSRPICSRRPVKAKNNGKSAAALKLPSFVFEQVADSGRRRHYDARQECSKQSMNTDRFSQKRAGKYKGENAGDQSGMLSASYSLLLTRVVQVSA